MSFIMTEDVPDVVSSELFKPAPPAKKLDKLPGERDKFGNLIPGQEIDPLPASAIPKSKVKPDKKQSKDKNEGKSKPPKKDKKDKTTILPEIQSDEQPVIHSKLDFSIFSDISYANKNKRQELLSKITNKFVYDTKNSTDELAVFNTRGINKKTVIAIRGTQTRGDVATDAGILFGNAENTRRYRRNTIQIKNIQDTLGLKKDDITLVGHSLGGSIAASQAAQFGYKAITFNAGFSPLSMIRDPNRNKYRNADITNYTTPFDVISLSSQLPNMPKTYVLPVSGTLNAHSIKNFTNQIGDYSVDRFDLFDKGSNTENTGTSLQDWKNIPIHPQPDHKKFTGKIGEKLPTPPSLWEIISGKKTPKVISTIDNSIKGVVNLVKPFVDPNEGFMAVRPRINPLLPEPTLDLGEPGDIELEDIFRAGEGDILGLQDEGIAQFFGDFVP